MSASSAWVGVEELYCRPLVARIEIHATLVDPDYERWRQDAKRLMKLIDLDLPFWQRLAAESARFSFLIHNSPLSPNSALPQQLLTPSLMELSYQQHRTADVQDALDAFWASRAILKRHTGSPFFRWLEDAIQRDLGFDRPALMVAKKDWTQLTRALTRSSVPLRRIDVVDLSTLSEPHPYDKVYVCGAISLFPPSLYVCSRARDIEWALFEWMRTELPPRDIGLASSPRPTVPAQVHRRNTVLGEVSEEEEVDATGIWKLLEQAPESGQQSDETGWFDTVQAVELLLVDGSRTFAPLLEKISIATAVDSWSPGTIWLNRKLGKDLMPDDFIIVRTYGDSDVILELANQLMGSRAPELRRAQALWKAKLVELRQSTSLDSLVMALRQAGSLIADYQNVRNWMSPRHIRTQSKEDFLAILRVCGLEDQGSTLWHQMGLIVRAHVRAGMSLKRQLTATLKRHSGSELLATGRLDVAHPGGDAGRLIAIRIDAIGEQREVREARLLRLVEPWHG